jgi:hypothetical protein
MATTRQLGWLGTAWLCNFSRPASERPVYRHVLARAPKRVLEIGLGTLVRTERMLRVAARSGGVQYIGLDRFEGRDVTDPPGVSLKEAHRRLHALARVQLVPGNVDTSLARLSNMVGHVDLVLISADNDERHLERCWFFIQRVVTEGSTVLIEPATRGPWAELPRSRLAELAGRFVTKRAG